MQNFNPMKFRTHTVCTLGKSHTTGRVGAKYFLKYLSKVQVHLKYTEVQVQVHNKFCLGT